jgi:hypothetical protein
MMTLNPEKTKMKHQQRPSIEALETKALLSHIALAFTGAHAGKAVPTVTGKALNTGIDTTVTTNEVSYTPGELVGMTLTETNKSGHDVFVAVGPSIDGFSITYGAKTIWRSNKGFTPQFIYRKLLLPGESFTLKAAWIARSVPGAYVAHNQMAPADVHAPFSIAGKPV